MANYVLLETIQLAQTTSSVTFDNIPQTGYTDLKIVWSGRLDDASTATYCKLTFNNSSSSFSAIRFYGSGSAAGSGSLPQWSGTAPGTSATSNTFSNVEFYIPNYTSSNYKSYSLDTVTENSATEAYAELGAGLWSNTAAITSITLTGNAGSFTQNSTFSLYAIAASGTTSTLAPKAAGGNIVATDGTYWYHAFTSSGYFTPLVSLSCSALVIGGGGAGGGYAGGGGAGGMVYSASQSLTGTNYAVTVGAGGNGVGANLSVVGGNGNNSAFNSLTAGAGGGGGSDASNTYKGADGAATNGSGGGGGFGSAAGAGNGTGGNGGVGNGYPGSTTPNYSSGGGRGAGANGGNATAQNGGNGGAGLNTYSSWATATSTGVSGYYAGGGGGGNGNGASGNGGTGGAGGGGNGNKWNSGGTTSGTANTGSGGGGNSQTGTSGNGGSGIVIIRYAV